LNAEPEDEPEDDLDHLTPVSIIVEKLPNPAQ
jgi:hypothetical protein